MQDRIKAIDFTYYLTTPEFIGKWNEAKNGELICRMHGTGHRVLASARQHGGHDRQDGCGGRRERIHHSIQDVVLSKQVDVHVRDNAVELFGI